MTGRLAGRLRRRLTARLAARLTGLKYGVLVILAGLFLANIACPPPLKQAYKTSTLVTDRQGRWLTAFTVESGKWRLKADMNEIDPRFIKRLLLIEDKRFYHHSGVDIPAIARALKSWRREGRPVSGASTLTMQLVKQLKKRPRTLGSKFVEILQAMQIETRLPKREILSLYLTHTPYGGNVEGVTAATHVYFDKRPDRLTDAEIALLIALPQAPEARRPDRHPKAAKAARDDILQKLLQKGALTQKQYKEAVEAPVISAHQSFPQHAWLAATGLKNRAGKSGKVVSSLDSSIQQAASELARSFTRDKTSNVAILVVENKTMKVRALVGSAGRDRPGGWIDMTARYRSPGSTLKPFIYGLAFDDGLATPGSFILDAPTRFGSYRPENFNRRYHGDVRISEALEHSLNVPAVLALDKVGIKRFVASLKSTGVTLQIPTNADGEAGLALALGGLGLTARDLAVLYAALANEGEAAPLVYEEREKTGKAVRLMRRKSARDITRILRQAPTPDGQIPHWLARAAKPVAYKTGTSYGFRDAWAAGYTDRWTVIVWTGRPDSSTLVGKTGRKAAAPLLFDIFAALPGEGRYHPFVRMDKAPKGIVKFGGKPEGKPQILFPPDGAEIALSAFGEQGKGLSLSARGPARTKLAWYVDGQKIIRTGLSNTAIWKPAKPGFYRVVVVDEAGRSTHVKVRVMRAISR